MKTRILIALVGLGAAAGYLGSCTAQPALPCPIASSNPYYGLPPYAGFYTLKSGSGTCSQKTYESIGFQRYNPPGTTDNSVAIRAHDIGAQYDNGRMDPADPDGKKVNALGNYMALPSADERCSASFEATGERNGIAEQTFEAIPEELDADGGVVTPAEPELYMKYKWTDLHFLVNARFPGTLFKGTVEYTEDTCTATYDVEGFWPEIGCSTDEDCDPNPNPDAGRTMGSGINPDFAPVTCDVDLGVCKLTKTFDELAAMK